MFCSALSLAFCSVVEHRIAGLLCICAVAGCCALLCILCKVLPGAWCVGAGCARLRVCLRLLPWGKVHTGYVWSPHCFALQDCCICLLRRAVDGACCFVGGRECVEVAAVKPACRLPVRLYHWWALIVSANWFCPGELGWVIAQRRLALCCAVAVVGCVSQQQLRPQHCWPGPCKGCERYGFVAVVTGLSLLA
mgnify:CR=1 FL=1